MNDDKKYRFIAESERKQLNRRESNSGDFQSPPQQPTESPASRQFRLDQEAAEIAQQIEDKEQEKQNQSLRDQKMRQVVRESSQELRDLERLISSAYVGKERVIQLKEMEARKQREKIIDLKYDLAIREQMNEDQKKEEQKDIEMEHVKREYGEDLEKQLETLKLRKQEEYQKFIQEKRIIDELVQKIIAEDEQAVLNQIAKQQDAKRFIAENARERHMWKQEEHQRIEDENRKIEQYQAVQEERKAEQKQKSLEQEKYRDELYNKLAGTIEEENSRRQEMDDMLIELNMEEGMEKYRKEQALLLEKRIKQRLEMLEANRMQKLEKQKKIQLTMAEDAAYRQMLADKLAEDDRLEQLSAQKKRMKQAEHRRIIDQIVIDRNLRRQQERTAEIEQSNGRDEIGKMRREIIEQERQRILRENAVNLLGYLPKGIFRDAADLQLFDQEFRDQVAASNRKKEFYDDSSDEDNWRSIELRYLSVFYRHLVSTACLTGSSVC